MPLIEQKLELLTFAKLRCATDKELCKSALRTLKQTFQDALKSSKTSWEKLGFQSEDHPETDVRGGGLLGVLILTHIAET